MYEVSFHINGAKRRRNLPFIPRVGDFVQIDDETEILRLKVKSVYYSEDEQERGNWIYWVNCDIDDR